MVHHTVAYQISGFDSCIDNKQIVSVYLTVADNEQHSETEDSTVEDMLARSVDALSADHSYYSKREGKTDVHICQCEESCSCCIGCMEKSALIQLLKDKIKELEDELERNARLKKNKKNKSFHSKILISDKKTKFYTGLPKTEVFYELYKHLQPKVQNMRYWRGEKNTITTANELKRKYLTSPKKFGPKRKLLQIDEMLLVLMRLRLGLLEQDLADRFEISVSTVSSTVFTWVRLLALVLKNEMITYPPKENIISHLPVDAKDFPNLRCIIDCTEIFIERPRELVIQALTYSDYKKHNTVKVLIGITPRGKISFLSKAWGGRTSDVHIVNESGFLNLIDPFDEIMADKGFTIENQLLLKGAKLAMPPGVKGRNQMMPTEVAKTKKIANFRIHVERAIGRMKEFNILNGIFPINMLPVADDVIAVCASLCNFLPPLVDCENLYPGVQ